MALGSALILREENGVPSLDSTFGAGLIGAFITMILYGITTLQTYLYFAYYPKDRLDLKLLVTSVWILDTLHTSLVGHALYYYVITNYANPIALSVGIWSLYSSVAINLVIAVLVQTYFALRIFGLCGRQTRWLITVPILIVVALHFGFGMETVVLMFIKVELSRISELLYNAATPFAISAVLSDVLIAVTLCVLLHGRRTGFKQTSTLLNTLIIYAINRCLLTAFVAIGETIAFALAPHALWFVAIDFVIGKLYANSLLATLNVRKSLGSHGSSVERESGNTTSTSVPMSLVGRPPANVNVNVVVDSRPDFTFQRPRTAPRPGSARSASSQKIVPNRDFLDIA